MADLNVNVKVNGEDKLNSLSSTIKGVESNTEKLSTKTVAMGNIYAMLAEKAVVAFSTMVNAGVDYNNTLEEMEGKIDTFASRQDGLSESFSALSYGLTESIIGFENMKSVMIDVSNVIDMLAGSEAKLRKARADHLVLEKEIEEQDKKRAKWKEQEHRKELSRIKAEEDANIRHQKILSALEEKVRKEKEQTTQKIKEQEEAYEANLRKVDEWIDEINNATDSTIQHSQAVDGNTQSVESNTQSIEANTMAMDAQGVGSASTDASYQQGGLAGNGATGTSSAPVISGATAYAYGTGMISYGNATGDYSREMKRQTAELKKLNNKVK